MKQFRQTAFEALRYAPWLTRERLLRWGKVCALLSIGLLAYDAMAHPASGGSTNGRDFYGFWSSAVLAVAGRPEAAYAIGPDHTFEQSLMYPPIMMLLCLPLAALPYDHALVVWILLGVGLFAWSISRLVGWPMAILATVAAPAAYWDLLSRQNGYFSAVLLASGLTLLDRRPTIAGVLLGMLCYKPQLGVLLPVALVAGGYWRAFGAAILCVSLMVVASAIFLGPESWIGFWDRVDLQRRVIEVAALSWTRMPTVFAMMRLLGASVWTAYVAQGISAITAAIAVAALWHARCPLVIKSAGLVVAIFLATSYIWDYDMIVLVFAAARLGNEAVETGFQPWEKIAVLALLTLPAFMFGPARLLGLQIAPILLWLSLAVVMRRGLNFGFPKETYPSRGPLGPASV